MNQQANLGNTIMPIYHISRGLGVGEHDSASQSWFIASFSCTVGAFVLITGRFGDLYGFKNMFTIGWVWFSIWSLACGFAPNGISFDIFRALAGIGPSILMPNAAALLANGWREQRKKNLAFAVFGAIAPAGFVIGCATGAVITECGGRWEWIFWSMAIVAAVIAVMGWVVIPGGGRMNIRGEGDVDWIGSFVGVAGLVLVFVALNGGPTFGWKAPTSGVLLAIGLLSLVAFCYIETRVAHPILPMSIFQSPTFVAVAVSLCLGWMSFGMFQFYAPHFLMEFRGLSQLETSLQFLPCAIVGIAMACMAVFLLPRVPGYVIFGISMLCFFLGQLLLALTPVEQTYWQMTFPTFLLICCGPDLSFACSSLIASDKLPKEQQGVAGSFINTIVNYSIALGLALAGNLEAATNDSGRDRLKGFRAAWYLGAGFAALGMVMTAVFHKGMSKRHK
ncbi:major facilitator superfamily [Morchella snyderi]|nr:major facilitator superfamily [Morchella snyderi]